jgi:hypothetical protein
MNDMPTASFTAWTRNIQDYQLLEALQGLDQNLADEFAM